MVSGTPSSLLSEPIVATRVPVLVPFSVQVVGRLGPISVLT
jgi:hypothetical protein